MSGLLYSFCAAWLSDQPASNETTLNECSRIFLIDGQAIPFAGLLSDLTGSAEAAEAALKDGGTFGDDSIHYQQVRSYELARELIEERNKLKSGLRLKVAIVGGGFSGLTAALTFLKRTDDVDVTLFEHHHRLLPRFSGAYGRQVHPYHHLRQPDEPTTIIKGDSGIDQYGWHCRWRGASHFEEGGIPGILPWKPGAIDQVVGQVRHAAKAMLQEFDGNRLTTRLGVRVLDLEPEVDGHRLAVRWLDTKKIRKPAVRTNMDIEEEEDILERFDVVILALGGMRDIPTIPGQSNLEYWTPMRMANSAPSSSRYEAAVIGAGNSAASETFNLLLDKGDFVELLQHVQIWANGTHQALARALKGSAAATTMTDFSDLLDPDDWEALAASVEKDLVATSALYSGDMIRVTLFVSNEKGGRLFSKMNPLNRFLVLLLHKLGYVRIENLYVDSTTRSKFVEEDYAITFGGPGKYGLLFKGKAVKSPSGEHWSYILNCAGPRRFYHEVFGPIRTLFKVKRDLSATGQPETLRVILEEKQTILRGNAA